MDASALVNRFARERRRIAALAAALLLVVSAYGVILSAAPRESPVTPAGADVLLLSVVLAAVSCAGIAAAARPSDCLGLLSLRKRRDPARGLSDHAGHPAPFPVVAHHCSCGRFADHALRIGDRRFCAGCLGMAAGGACGIGLAMALGAGLLFFDPATSLAAILLGVTVATAGLVALYRPSPPGMHAAANLAFVVGAVLLAAPLAAHGIAAGAFGILAALALVGLRIEMSRWRHLSIYAGCPWPGSCRGTSALAAARRPIRRSARGPR